MEPEKKRKSLLIVLWLALAVPIVLVAAVACSADGATFGTTVGLGLFVVAAAGIVGALIGFLFGLPRGPAPNAERLSSNTNLEEVSDWLTKILVGLGLIQLGDLAGGLDGVADDIALGFDFTNADLEKTFALSLLVYSLILGFFVGYLGTRLVITTRFKEIEDALAVVDEPAFPPPPDLPLVTESVSAYLTETPAPAPEGAPAAPPPGSQPPVTPPLPPATRQ